MRYKRHGTTLLAVLVVAIMGLSVFAMPVAAAANDVESAETNEVDADSLTSDVTKTANTTLNPGGTASVGDRVTLNLISGTAGVDQGDFKVLDASINKIDPDGGGQITANSDISVSTFSGVYADGKDDSVALQYQTSGSLTSDKINVTIEYEIDTDVQDETGITGDNLFKVGTDEVGTLNGGTVAKLDVYPGQPDEIKVDSTQYQTTFNSSTSAIVTALDQHNNPIQQGDVNSGFQSKYNNLEIGASMTDSTGSTVDSFQTGNKTINYSSGTDAPADQITLTIDPNTGKDDEIGPELISDQLTLTVTNSSATDATAEVDVVPEGITITHNATSIVNDGVDSGAVSADDGTTGVEVTLQDSSPNNIPNSEIDALRLDFDSIDSNSVEPDIVTSGGTTIDSTNSQFVIEDNLNQSNSIQFQATDNDYDDAELGVTVDPRGGTTGVNDDTADLDVVAGQPSAIAFQSSQISDKLESADKVDDITVEVEDAQGNTIDDRTFGSTNVKVNSSADGTEIGSEADIDVGTGSGGGVTTVDLHKASTDTSQTDEIAVAAGEIDLQVVQMNTGGSFGVDVASDTATLDAIPEVQVQNDIGSDINAGVKSSGAAHNYTVELTRDDGTTELADADVGAVDIEFRLLNTTDEIAGEETDDLIVSGNTVGETGTTTTTTSRVEVGYNITSAAEYKIDANATIQDSDKTDKNSSNFDVDALNLDTSQSSITLPDRDFAGTVFDSNTLTVEIVAKDKFGNFIGYTDNPNTGGDIDLNATNRGTGSAIQTDVLTTGAGTGVGGASVEAASQKRVFELDTDSVFNDAAASDSDSATTDGENLQLVDTGSSTVNKTKALELVHEAYNLNTEYQRVSVPQPVDEAVTQDTGVTTTWNTSAETYESNDVSLGSVDVDELHKGIFIEGNSGNPYVGFRFDTSAQGGVADRSLQDGWNFLGTNFDISNKNSHSLAEDLRTVYDIDDDPDDNQVVYDGALNTLISADATGTNDSTTTLGTDDVIDYKGGTDKGEFGTYWVYVEDASAYSGEDGTGDQVRQILEAPYDPVARGTVSG